MELRDQIRRAREAAKLTQEQLAELVGVDKRTVRNWEAGRVPRNAIGQIEQVLGIDLSSGEDDQSPTLQEATDAQLVAGLAGRLAERDRRIAELTAEVDALRRGEQPAAAGARWAARIRESGNGVSPSEGSDGGDQ